MDRVFWATVGRAPRRAAAKWLTPVNLSADRGNEGMALLRATSNWTGALHHPGAGALPPDPDEKSPAASKP